MLICGAVHYLFFPHHLLWNRRSHERLIRSAGIIAGMWTTLGSSEYMNFNHFLVCFFHAVKTSLSKQMWGELHPKISESNYLTANTGFWYYNNQWNNWACRERKIVTSDLPSLSSFRCLYIYLSLTLKVSTSTLKFQKPTNSNIHLHPPLSEIFLRCKQAAFLILYGPEGLKSQRALAPAFSACWNSGMIFFMGESCPH